MWERIKFLVRMYLRFAAVHSLFKIVRLVLSQRGKIRKLQAQLKGPKWDWSGMDIINQVHRINDWRTDMMNDYLGEPMIVGPAPDPEVIVFDPKYIKTFLKDEFNKVGKPPRYQQTVPIDLLSEFLGYEGIFCITHTNQRDNQLWKFQRKLASRLFSVNIYRQIMDETFSPKVDILCDVLDQVAAKNASISSNSKAEGAHVIDMQDKFFCFTMDSVQEIFFHRKGINTVGGTMDKYAAAYDTAHREFMKFSFQSLPVAMMMNVLPFPFGRLFLTSHKYSPGWELFKKMHPTYQKFWSARQYLHKETLDFVKTARTADLSGRNDLLSFFLRGSKGLDVELTDDLLVKILLSFIIAGRDTTAVTLSWATFYLATNPEVQEELAKELKEKLDGKKPQSLEDMHHSNMPVLNGVLMETLRLAPPVPGDPKWSYEDVTFPNGVTVPAGCMIWFLPFSQNRDPRVYPNPEKFDPNRWSNLTELEKDPDFLFKWPVFQAGPRTCLGMDLARHEAKYVIASVFQNFSFSLETSEKPEEFRPALMATGAIANKADHSEHSLWVVPRRRQ